MLGIRGSVKNSQSVSFSTAMRNLCIGVALTTSVAAFASSPRELVDDFHDTLLAVMQSGADFEARYGKIEPSVDRLFDLTSISRISLGRDWRNLDVATQQMFIDLLREFIIATYADRFASFNGQRFETVDDKEARPGRWVVRTHLVKSDGDIVTLDYYLREGLVFNVVADGVSDLSLRRADYAAIIERSGLEGLVSDIRQRIDEVRSGNAAE